MDALVHPRYEIGAVLAVGGMAEIREGWDHRLGRSVVIKRLRPDKAGAPEMREWFERELKLAPRLSHAGLVDVVDVDELAGVPFLVLERLSGETLDDRLALGPLGPFEMLSLTRQLLGALSVVHAAGVVHGDLKPSNVLRTAAGAWKLGDFGVSVPRGGGTAVWPIGHARTPEYAAPELTGNAPGTARSDLYSLGMVLFEGMTGRRPERVPPRLEHLEALRRDLDVRVVNLVVRCLQPSPWLRPSSAQSALQELGAAGDSHARSPRQRLPTVRASFVTAPISGRAAAIPPWSPASMLRASWLALAALLCRLSDAARTRWLPTCARFVRTVCVETSRDAWAVMEWSRPRVASGTGFLRSACGRTAARAVPAMSLIVERARSALWAGTGAAGRFARRALAKAARDGREAGSWSTLLLRSLRTALRRRWWAATRECTRRDLVVMAAALAVLAVACALVVAVLV